MDGVAVCRVEKGRGPRVLAWTSDAVLFMLPFHYYASPLGERLHIRVHTVRLGRSSANPPTCAEQQCPRSLF